MFRERVLPHLIKFVFRTLQSTWRLDVIEAPDVSQAILNNEPFSFAFWHGDELGLLPLLGRYRCCVMTSTSKDGELMDSVLKLMGVQSSRGSSTRGGVGALKGILRLSKDGFRPAIAVDGPKGPFHKVKPGVCEIAKVTGGAIVTAGCAVSNKFVFEKSWNKAYLPLPFATVVVHFNYGLARVPREQDAHDPELAASLERSLNDASDKAVARLAEITRKN